MERKYPESKAGGCPYFCARQITVMHAETIKDRYCKIKKDRVDNAKPFDGCRYGHHSPNNIVMSLVVLLDVFP